MDIRRKFLEFFRNKGHEIYPSMPLVPNDASLLFTNAGMVQFKDIFTGKIPIPTPPRATSSQLCIRAGGKHNDLENVGFTRRHHTLFEMLGNFSFGDYFKEEAISYAWEFVTQNLGLDPSILYVSVHEEDEEALKIWGQYLPISKIKKMKDKDNFWQMGDVGPCGPCSEIFVDQGESFGDKEDYFGGEGDRFLEIWNLVFMQYERHANGSLTPLPKPSIDTGMGFERILALLEKKRSNFDSSLFMPLIERISQICHKPYIYEKGGSFRVIADHARTVAFLLAQGVNFDREGRGYVLRRILRRALRHGYLLGIQESFLYKIVEEVCGLMGDFYTHLIERKDFILQQCQLEEERFLQTLDSGLKLFDTEVQNLNHLGLKTLDGKIAFKLYDTFGFPLDITQDMLKEQGLNLDLEGFEKCMSHQKEQSKASWKGSGVDAREGDFKMILSKWGVNQFVGYEHREFDCKVLCLFDENFTIKQRLSPKEKGYVMLDATPFYPESGGAIGDKGKLLSSHGEILAHVLNSKCFFEINLSHIECELELQVEQSLRAQVDEMRLEVAKHHTATHLLHAALREKFGPTLTQAGSLVEPSRLRFDFHLYRPLTPLEIQQIQENVNTMIRNNLKNTTEYMSLDLAKSKGALALFGEKYSQNVRVVSFGKDSCELCGGIHVPSTALLGNFIITKESGVSAGVRRIEAICGEASYRFQIRLMEEQEQLKAELKTKDLLPAIQKLKLRIKDLEKELLTKESSPNLKIHNVDHYTLIVQEVKADLKRIVDEVKNQHNKVAILLINEQLQIVGASKETPIKANQWVKDIAFFLGGNGGGREDFATGSGKAQEKENTHQRIQQALQLALKTAKHTLTNPKAKP